MITDNKLDKSFGQTGVFAGYILIITGILVQFSTVGLLIIIVGAFMSFSHSGVSIDIDEGKIMFYNKLFGLFKLGNTEDLGKFDLITVAYNKRSSRTFSRGNRVLNIDEYDYRIFLSSPKSKKRIPIKKCKSKEEANNEANKLSSILNIPLTK